MVKREDSESEGRWRVPGVGGCGRGREGTVVVSEPGLRGAGLGRQLAKVLDESQYRY